MVEVSGLLGLVNLGVLHEFIILEKTVITARAIITVVRILVLFWDVCS